MKEKNFYVILGTSFEHIIVYFRSPQTHSHHDGPITINLCIDNYVLSLRIVTDSLPRCTRPFRIRLWIQYVFSYSILQLIRKGTLERDRRNQCKVLKSNPFLICFLTTMPTCCSDSMMAI